MSEWVTDWFPPNINPVRVGWYERCMIQDWWAEEAELIQRAWWSGVDWKPFQAYPGHYNTPMYWRGLTEEGKRVNEIPA